MTLLSRLFARIARLPPAETYDVAVEKDIRIPMPDGVRLLADHYYPRQGALRKRPVILVRSPYGRRGVFGLINGRVFAERGFQVLIQSCRGTADSGGKLNPMRQERADGLATLDWMRKQDWYDGRLAMNGASYLGYVQWAIAAEVGSELQAMAVQVTSPDFRRVTYPGEGFALDNTLSWTRMVSTETKSGIDMLDMMRGGGRKVEAAYPHLPLGDLDTLAVGRRIDFWQDWLHHNMPGDAWWTPQDHWLSASKVNAPVHVLGGWYDIFLPDTLRLYRTLRGAGRETHLLVGPWTHASLEWMGVGAREALAWFRAHLLGDRGGLREKPVHLFVMGANEWRDQADWPPAGYRPQHWHLHPGRGLAPEPPADSDPDPYRYDPADPTPAAGGVSLGQNSGPKDQRRLEARPDVLTYTSAPLEREVEAAGPVQAELFVRSSLAYTDFFVSVCDVDPSGRSINITGALCRTRPGRPAPEADGGLHLCFDLWATAHRFKRGHRLRVQVSSGAHPHYARNLGSGEPLATGKTMKAADQAVYHDPEHPSAVILPVLS